MYKYIKKKAGRRNTHRDQTEVGVAPLRRRHIRVVHCFSTEIIAYLPGRDFAGRFGNPDLIDLARGKR